MTAPHTQQSHKVFTKLNWSDNEWVEQENLFADYAVFSCAPDISKAQLYWRYGRVMGYGENEFETREKKDLLDYYVQIEIDRPDDDDGEPQDPLRWYGIVVSDSREIEGPWLAPPVVPLAPVAHPAGKQIIECLGLEYLLTRKVIDTSIVATGSGTENTINRAIGFNLGPGHDNSSVYWPNCNFGTGDKGTYIFASQLDGATVLDWRAIDILKYVLAYHSPANEAGEIDLQWGVSADSNATHLEWQKPMLRVHGHTVFDVLNMLVDRRRLSSWKVVVEDTGPKVYVFTFNPEDIDLPDGKTILANDSQFTWNFDTTVLVRQPVLTSDAASEFIKVTARGERRGFCFTIAQSETTLEADWSSALQTAYNAGASAQTGYAAADETDKQDRNKAEREREKYRRVYKYFRVPPTWNGSTATVNNVFLNLDDPVHPLKYWVPGFRFEPKIPLKTDITYGDTIAAEDLTSTTGDTLAKSKKEFRPPFAVINTADAGATAKYEDVHALSQGDSTVAYHSNGRTWSCSLRMADDAPSIILDVSGAPQHMIASNEFTGVDDADKAVDPPELDWRTVYCTVFLLGDCYAEQTWPDLPFPTTDDVAKVLIIDVPNMRLDYVVPSTVTHLNSDGSLQRTANGGYIHDDRAKLKEIARVAYQWYSTPRQAIDASEHSFNVFEVGDLITTIGAVETLETVNSVVTQLSIDLRHGVASYKTAFGELDFSKVNHL